MKTVTNKAMFDAITDCIELRWKPRAKDKCLDIPSCQLCAITMDTYFCEMCPIVIYGKTKDMDHSACHGTPNDDWFGAQNGFEAMQAAQREVEFLEEVRDHFFNPDGSLKEGIV